MLWLIFMPTFTIVSTGTHGNALTVLTIYHSDYAFHVSLTCRELCKALH